MNFTAATFRFFGVILMGVACLPWSDASAQTMREIVDLPRDCRSLAPPSAIGTVQHWQVFVRLEHCDRMKRLRRLSEVLPPDQRPRFYEGIIPASRLPIEFGTDLPVLRVVFPDRTFFDTGQSVLRPEAAMVSMIIAESLRREPPDVAMFVAGHADSRGSDALNEILSINRADAVARAIFALGVRNSSIWRIGFGEDMPLYSGQTEADFAANRRVEFLFSSKPEAVATWLVGEQFGVLCQSASESDSRACKDRLRFHDDYILERVVSARPAPTIVKPITERSVRVSPRQRTASALSPAPPVRAQIIPSGSTRIRIDPVNARSKPVRVDL